MAQQVKVPVLSLQWLGSLLWQGFDSWPRNFHLPQARPKKKNQVEETDQYTGRQIIIT